MPAPKKVKRELLFKWLGLTDDERFRANLPLDPKSIMRHLQIGATSYHKWSEEFYAKQLGDDIEEPEEEEGDYDSPTWLKERSAEVDAALLRAVKDGKPLAIKLFKELIGEYVQKQEVTLKIDGSLIARAAIRAERELREAGYGVDEVQAEPVLLREELRLPSGQDKGTDSPV